MGFFYDFVHGNNNNAAQSDPASAVMEAGERPTFSGWPLGCPELQHPKKAPAAGHLHLFRDGVSRPFQSICYTRSV